MHFFITLLLCLSAFCLSLNSYADSLQDTKDQRDLASQNYYRALRSLGHVPTEKEKSDILNKVLLPSVAAYEQMTNQVIGEAHIKMRETMIKNYVYTFHRDDFPKLVLKVEPSPKPNSKLTQAESPEEEIEPIPMPSLDPEMTRVIIFAKPSPKPTMKSKVK